jgi:hypothetical protein
VPPGGKNAELDPNKKKVVAPGEKNNNKWDCVNEAITLILMVFSLKLLHDMLNG